MLVIPEEIKHCREVASRSKMYEFVGYVDIQDNRIKFVFKIIGENMLEAHGILKQLIPDTTGMFINQITSNPIDVGY